MKLPVCIHVAFLLDQREWKAPLALSENVGNKNEKENESEKKKQPVPTTLCWILSFPSICWHQ